MYHGMIYIGSDHGGFELKGHLIKFLAEQGYRIKDSGPFLYDPEDDYPDFAARVCREVVTAKAKGILVCRSGVGMDIAANKFNGVYSATCMNVAMAKASRKHNDSNVICIAGDYITQRDAKQIVKTWIETPFEGGRHLRRISKVKQIEKSQKR